ncbi:DUF551 domain-containing protein [Enterobacter asburiae]|uniref:DUF551 domain-containing protein n=1 Tax=Scandinavium sp. UTDF21-P1B TaxID=3446379 RepID=UPI0034720AD2
MSFENWTIEELFARCTDYDDGSLSMDKEEFAALRRMLQGAENDESRCGIQTAPVLDSLPKNDDSRCSNSPVIPDGWVACSERMPEHGGLYLCYVQDEHEFDISHFCFEYLAAHKKFDSAGLNITHWMPLPAAPQEVK